MISNKRRQEEIMKHFVPAAGRTPAIAEYEALKFGVFVHFNMQQFVYTKDEFTQVNDPQVWNPTDLDVEQWFRRWKEAGVKHAVLTTKHTSDFCLWDTKTTESNVMNSPVPVDIVKEFVTYARKYEIKPCFYYCIWGGAYNPKEHADELMLEQIEELLTKYGDIYLMWMDMANWRPEGMTVQGIYDFIKNRQPDTLVHFNQHIQDGTALHYFPTDAVNGEERIPPETGHIKLREVDKETYYLPFEYEICLQKVEENVGKGYVQGTRWFTYSAREGMTPSHPAPIEELYPFIHKAYQRGASNVILSTAPDFTGRVREEDAAALTQIRSLIDRQAEDCVQAGSLYTTWKLCTTRRENTAASLRIRLKEDRKARMLGCLFTAEDKTDAELTLLTADGRMLCTVICKADAPSDMLGFSYETLPAAVTLEAGREYILVTERREHYADITAKTTECADIVSGIPLLSLVFEEEKG